jgi:hypothetical protein
MPQVSITVVGNRSYCSHKFYLPTHTPITASPLHIMANHAEADDDDVPGTVHLVDVTGQNSSSHHDASQKDIVLIPQPSSDPEDPLNWDYRRKILAVSMAYLYVLGTGIATSLQ